MLTFLVRSILDCGLNQPVSYGTSCVTRKISSVHTNLHSDTTGITFHPTHPTPSHLVGGSDCSDPHILASPTAVGLPAELLVWIFRLGGGGQLRFFSQVCKRWRVVALSTSSLWMTALNLTHGTQWVCEVLRRIDTAPLDIQILFDTRFTSLLIRNAIMVMQEHLHRFRSLDIVAPRHTMAQILDSVGVEFASLPRLECISIGAEYDYFQEIHPSLLSIHVRNLQQLYLKDFSIDWFVLTRSNLFISSRLSTLHLIDPDKHLTPSICQLLSVLAAIPTLTELCLRHAFRIHDKEGDGVQAIPRAELGNLTTLEVADHIRLCGAIMGAIQTPSLTCLEIEATTNDCMKADIVAFMAIMHTLSPQRQVDILLIACAEDSFTLQAHSFTSDHKETPHLLITLFWDDDDMNKAYLSLMASSILQLPFLHTATHLHVATDQIRDPTGLVSPESWYEILGGFRAVSMLDLYLGTIMLLIGLYHDALLVKNAAKNQRDFEILLPSLQTIAAPQSDMFDALLGMIAELRRDVGFPALKITKRKLSEQ